MDNKLHPSKVWDEIQRIIMDVITCPYWDLTYTMLVKGASGTEQVISHYLNQW